MSRWESPSDRHGKRGELRLMGSFGDRWGIVGESLGNRWGVVGVSLGCRWSVVGVSLSGRWERFVLLQREQSPRERLVDVGLEFLK